MTEREFEVNRIIHDAGTIVVIDDAEFSNLSKDEIHQIIINTAMHEDNWQRYDELGDDDISFEVLEN